MRKAAPDGLVCVVAAGLGRDGVVLHREGQVGPAHRPLLLLQLLEGVRRVQLVQHVPVDIDELAAIGALRDQMGIPDLVEQGVGHDVATFGSKLVGRIACSVVASGILGGPTVEGKRRSSPSAVFDRYQVISQLRRMNA